MTNPTADLDLWRVALNGTAFIGMRKVNADGTAGPGMRAGDGEYIYARDALREIERLRSYLQDIACLSSTVSTAQRWAEDALKGLRPLHERAAAHAAASASDVGAPREP